MYCSEVCALYYVLLCCVSALCALYVSSQYCVRGLFLRVNCWVLCVTRYVMGLSVECVLLRYAVDCGVL
jgi:hypothetical protein